MIKTTNKDIHKSVDTFSRKDNTGRVWKEHNSTHIQALIAKYDLNEIITIENYAISFNQWFEHAQLYSGPMS